MIAVSAVVWKLKSVGAIAALVGPTTPYRIFPRGGVPQSPDLSYIVVDNPPGQEDLGIHSSGTIGLMKTPIAVYCYAATIEKAQAIAVLVRPALSPVSGVTGSVSWNGTSIDHCTIRDCYEHLEPQQDGSEVQWKAMLILADVFHLNCTS